VYPIEGDLTEEERRLADELGVEPTVRVDGCDHCSGSGYRGRLPLVEVFSLGPTIQEMVRSEATSAELNAVAEREGMRTLRTVGLEQVQSGDTTLQELARVLGEVVETPRVDPADRAVAEALGAVGEATTSEPAVTPEAAETPVAASTPVPGIGITEEDLGAPHILVVDDDGTNRMIVRAVLEKEGYQITEAADGDAALEILKLGVPFDLMVLDLDMPKVSGDEVLTEVRSSLSTAGLPVVVLTGTTDPDAEYRLLEKGADDYIRKPLDPPRLAVRVKAALRRAAG
jgi:CheY-like chemotaxis protein